MISTNKHNGVRNQECLSMKLLEIRFSGRLVVLLSTLRLKSGKLRSGSDLRFN